MPRLFAGAVTVVACTSCGAGGKDLVTTPIPEGVSAAAGAYLNSALDIMQQYSFYRAKLDWTKLRADAMATAASAKAQTPAQTYPAIRSALTALGDHHSFLQPPASGASYTPGVPNSASAFTHPSDSLDGEMIGGRYGYIRVPTYAPLNGGNAAQSTAMADTLQGLIRVVDAQSPCGWVVDLRHNRGGNMWPMLAGIGPVVGEGTNLGGFLGSTGVRSSWFYLNGAAGNAGVTSASVSRAAHVLRKTFPPVAVLTDGFTGSSGEAITVAFRGRPATRSFGAATAGVPTANSGFPLSDGAQIWLMVALDVDRLGNQYIDPIVPDQVMATTAPPATDDGVVAAATTWLATLPACAAP